MKKLTWVIMVIFLNSCNFNIKEEAQNATDKVSGLFSDKVQLSQTCKNSLYEFDYPENWNLYVDISGDSIFFSQDSLEYFIIGTTVCDPNMNYDDMNEQYKNNGYAGIIVQSHNIADCKIIQSFSENPQSVLSFGVQETMSQMGEMESFESNFKWLTLNFEGKTQNMGAYIIKKSKEAMQANNVDSHIIEGTVPNYDESFRSVHAFIADTKINENALFHFTACAPLDKWENYQEIFRSVLKSIRRSN